MHWLSLMWWTALRHLQIQEWVVYSSALPLFRSSAVDSIVFRNYLAEVYMITCLSQFHSRYLLRIEEFHTLKRLIIPSNLSKKHLTEDFFFLSWDQAMRPEVDKYKRFVRGDNERSCGCNFYRHSFLSSKRCSQIYGSWLSTRDQMNWLLKTRPLFPGLASSRRASF